MSPIVPAVIPKSKAHLDSALRVISSFTHEVQIDIVDGRFVPFVSWPYEEKGDVEDLRELGEGFRIEVDLMIRNPEEVVESYLKAGVRQIVIHLESTEVFAEILAFKNKYDFRVGLSIDNGTPLELLLNNIERADYVQLMGIAQIGSQGQGLDERVLSTIGILREKHPKLLISIDGSVNRDTVMRFREAGADRFVSGSAILDHQDPRKAYQELLSLARRNL
jgi:ribulose-phosphate 3-epimerase